MADQVKDEQTVENSTLRISLYELLLYISKSVIETHPEIPPGETIVITFMGPGCYRENKRIIFTAIEPGTPAFDSLWKAELIDDSHPWVGPEIVGSNLGEALRKLLDVVEDPDEGK